MKPISFLLAPAFALVLALGYAALPAGAQRGDLTTGDEARAALERAQAQSRRARQRGQAFEAQERASTAASDKARARAAALAARVQQEEAAIAVAEAQLALIDRNRRALGRRLAQRREPIAELVAALQTLIRRPLTLSLLRPGSLRETVYLSAVLDSTMPMVRARTADLRAEIDRVQALREEASRSLADRRAGEQRLARNRAQLLAVSERERIAARRAGGSAAREGARALALAEEVRDIDGLVARLDEEGTLRRELAALPGPVLRPANPAAARSMPRAQSAPSPTPSATAPPARYRLPVDGRLAAGFGAPQRSGARGTGLELVPRKGAQVVAPAAGRVSFAAPYRGFGRIVIIEHANGWTSLVTGLADLDAAVGQEVVAGSPLGRAGSTAPRIALELHRRGVPVNPLDYLAGGGASAAR